jgi:hypothetical protein
MDGFILDGLTLAGRFSVDSGQAMIGDPCYLDSYNPNTQDDFELEGQEGEYSYLGACATTINKQYGELGSGSAVVVSTGYGDGQYPVYVKLNSDGRVCMVVIDFLGELESEDE